jgi:hypothetical protein
MKYRFPYAYYNLGELSEGDTVVVRLRGAAANVLLLDRQNFERYRVGLRFAFLGGRRLRSPVRLRVPYDGHWFVALDLGGRPGRARGAVSVVPADGAERDVALTESAA